MLVIEGMNCDGFVVPSILIWDHLTTVDTGTAREPSVYVTSFSSILESSEDDRLRNAEYVVYFYQRLAAAHSKRWLKWSFSAY